MEVSVLGIDLGKNSCSVVGLDGTGRVVVRRRMRRETVIAFAGSLAPCVVAMEACCGAHHMGRALVAHGHTVRLMSPGKPGWTPRQRDFAIDAGHVSPSCRSWPAAE